MTWWCRSDPINFSMEGHIGITCRHLNIPTNYVHSKSNTLNLLSCIHWHSFINSHQLDTMKNYIKKPHILSVELINKINSFFKRLLQFGYISDRILVGDLLDDANHDLFRKICHSHHSLNNLLPPKRIFTNLRARAVHPFHLPEYATLLHKSHILWESYISMLYLLATDLLDLCVIVISLFLSFINVAFVCALSHEWKIAYLLTYLFRVFSLCSLFSYLVWSV